MREEVALGDFDSSLLQVTTKMTETIVALQFSSVKMLDKYC
jgi:hypothetical protein